MILNKVARFRKIFEQIEHNLKSINNECQIIQRKIDGITYDVSANFSKNSAENVQNKLRRIILNNIADQKISNDT